MDGVSLTLSLLLICMLSFQGGNAQNEPGATVQLNLPAGKCVLFSFFSQSDIVREDEHRLQDYCGSVCSVDSITYFVCRALLPSSITRDS